LSISLKVRLILWPELGDFGMAWSHNNWNLTFYISAAVYSMGILFWALLDPVSPIDPAKP